MPSHTDTHISGNGLRAEERARAGADANSHYHSFRAILHLLALGNKASAKLRVTVGSTGMSGPVVVETVTSFT